jgi:hypothetical protein
MYTSIISITYSKLFIFSNFLLKMASIIFIYALEIGTIVDIQKWTIAQKSQNNLKLIKVLR